MCHFSYEENYIFLRIPKCAGSSWVRERDDKNPWDIEPTIKHGTYTYLMAKDVFSKIDRFDFFESCNIFARVREPISRMKSFYCWLQSNTDQPFYRQSIDLNFENFTSFVCNQNDSGFMPCYNHLTDENGLIPERIQIERVEDISRGALKINTSKSYRVEVTKTAEEIIKGHFKKDYETWY